MLGLDLPAMSRSISRTPLYQSGGRLKSVTGQLLTCKITAALGDLCSIVPDKGPPIRAEVIGFENDHAFLVPFESAENLRPGMTVLRKGGGLTVPVGASVLGRVIDGLGRPLDDLGPLDAPTGPVHRPAPAALDRQRIREPFVTGVRAIDGMLTCGLGQRVGIFAGSGVGKSTLLGDIAKGSNADVNVIALVGERGREVAPFLEDSLGREGMARSVVVVATCEQTPLMRVRATQAAIAIADSFRDDGANVLLMVDSLTRLAIAQRELGLLLGEPPSARGYTPSVFQMLANTIERLGNSASGGITALLTVLVDGGDMDEPVADAVRSFVDGHIVLDRKIAERGFFPAIDVSRSISRVATDVVDREHALAARKFRAILSTHAEVYDLIRIGAYARGSSPQVDRALELMPRVEAFLRQDVGEHSTYEQTRARLLEIGALWPY